MPGAALTRILQEHMNVAEAETYVESLLQAPAPKTSVPPRAPAVRLRDARLFLNSVARGLETLRRAGIDARSDLSETEAEYTISIMIPKPPGR